MPLFCASLAAGIAALVVSAFIQYIFFLYIDIDNIFFIFFVRIALVEETGRLAVLMFLFALTNRISTVYYLRERCTAAAGLVSALAFGALESAWYTIESPRLALLRILTSVPLHAACGARAGRAAYAIPVNPAAAARIFFKTVALHGCYNYFVAAGGRFVFIAPILALTAFAAQAISISQTERLDESS
jgi:hypothetical protein